MTNKQGLIFYDLPTDCIYDLCIDLGDKTNYVVMSRDQNTGRSHSTKIDNSSFERVEQFRHLGTTLTNQNSIQE